jgi:hypothetical protein
MENVNKVTFVEDGWGYERWASVKEFDDASEILYCENSNEMYLNSGNGYRRDTFLKQNPNAVTCSPEISKAVRNKLLKVVEAKEKREATAAFQTACMGGSGTARNNILTVNLYLSGGTEGGGDLSIKGDKLCYYNDLYAVRIAPDEYLLGEMLSGSGSNNSSCCARVLYEFMMSDVVCWPTLIGWRFSNIITPSEEVMAWCINQLRTIQLKSPTAKKYKVSYDRMFKKAKRVYLAVKERWPEAEQSSLPEEIENLIAIHGDKKAMKQYNAGLRMRFEMGGFK